MASATGSKLLPLYICGNAPGARTVSKSLGLTEMSRWFGAAKAGEFKTVFLIGADVIGTIPNALAQETLGRTETVIAASAMPTATTRRADIILPCAFWFETSGKALDHSGQPIPLNTLGSPPGGAMSPGDLVSRLASCLGVEGVEPVDVDVAASWAKATAGWKVEVSSGAVSAEGENDSLVVMSRTETLDLDEGGLSRQVDWVGTIEPVPVALVNPLDAAELGIRDRDMISLRAAGGQAELSVRTSNAVAAHTVAVPSNLPEVIDLFEWRLNGDCSIEVGPSRAGVNAVRAEE